MKRLSGVTIFVLSLFLFISLFFPHQTYAQPTNKFDCEWIPGPPGFCRVDATSVSGCAPGNCADPSSCVTTDESDCGSRVGIDCRSCGSTNTPTPPPPITPPPGSTCTGERTGLIGDCKSTILGCGSGWMKDESVGCPFGQSCCVAHGVECGLAGGECKTIAHNLCPDNYEPTPLGGWGDLQCRTQEACCRPLQNGCYTAFSCNPGDTRCDVGRCCPNADDCPVFDPGWGSIPKVKVPVFCKSNDPGDRTTDNTGNLATAIGCIPITGSQAFTTFILRWAFGIGGGIAFLLILYAGFMLMTSSGDPKKLQAGRELLTSAVSGLLLLIFSVFILRIIGVDILGIPGLGG